MATKEITLKLMIHKEKNQIVYAESGNDFVDVLLSFLTMPLGTVIRLTGKQSEMGSLNNLFGSVEDLDVQYLQTESCKSMLLYPKSASEEHCRKLMVNIDDTEPTNYYLCNCGYFPLRSDFNHLISEYLSSKQCRCGSTVNWKMPKDKSKQGAGPAGDTKDGVFVKGISRYMITDDFQISPICMGTTLELLKRLGITDATVLEEKNVNLGSEEVLHLLKHSLLSKTPLTDVFLPLQHPIDRVALDLKVMTLDSKDMAQSHTEKESCSNSKNISVRLFLSKSRNKVLYAQVGKEFPDMLFSFLAFPLGSLVKCLDGEPGKCYHGNQKIQLEFINPKFCDVVTELGGVFMAGQATFMVTDELLVKPLSSISCLSLLNQFNLPLSDLEERFVNMGEEEALSLLKACLISRTVLSDVFLKKSKHLGRRSSLYS
eukprot:TRINITY_DN9789_c0_g2_i6.p1 TRINITY_DN9789_c0_g2~~TRINITY_DN9789_c0_g2_i6.p1  ORF type:complete len:429 (+),score=62.38 TRINITY_DN9789_c0_g2_i6:166-1452(+)